MENSKPRKSKKCPRCGREMPTRTAHDRRKKHCTRIGPQPKTIEQLKKGRKKYTCCKTIKKLSEFPSPGYYENGMKRHGSHCIQCRAGYQKRYYFKNPDVCRQKMKDYDQKAAPKIRERRKAYYKKNRSRILEEHAIAYRKKRHERKLYNQKYYLENKVTLNRKCKEYRQKNKLELYKKHNAYVIERCRIDPKFKIERNLNRLINHVINGRKSRSLEEYLGYSIETLLVHFDKGEYKVQDYQQGGHCIDHIIPKSLYDEDEMKLCFAYENLRIVPIKRIFVKAIS